MSHKVDSALALLGGFLCHLVLGSFYLWPNVIVYITSYFRAYGNPDLTISTANLVFPVMIICQSIAMPFGMKIGNKIGFRNELLLGVSILSVSVFTSSFMTNFWTFIIFYGLIFGLVNGACYIVPIRIGLTYLPHWKGKVSGMIVCGFGMGAFFLSYIAQYLINPDNITPSIHNPEYREYYFDERVYTNVPFGLKILACVYLIVGCTGAMLIKELTPEQVAEYKQKFDTSHDDHKKVYPQTAKQGFSSCVLYQIVFFTFVAAGYGGMLVPNIKNYGRLHITNDSVLTTIGALGAFGNGIFRIGWGTLMDKFSYRTVALLNLVIQLACATTIQMIAHIWTAYGIWAVVSYICFGGLYALQPAITMQIFGHDVGAVVYGAVFGGFASASLFQFFFVRWAVPNYGWSLVFTYYMFVVVLAIVLVFVFPWKKDWTKEVDEYNNKKEGENKEKLLAQEQNQ